MFEITQNETRFLYQKPVTFLGGDRGHLGLIVCVKHQYRSGVTSESRLPNPIDLKSESHVIDQIDHTLFETCRLCLYPRKRYMIFKTPPLKKFSSLSNFKPS